MGGSLLNCRRTARWTETTDSCFTNCSTQNAFCSGVAIIALLRHRLREKRGVGLRMRTKLEHLLFRSMWETYFNVRFENRNGRLKLLQSFWCTVYSNSTTNEMHLLSQIIYSFKTFYMFRTVFPSIIRTSKLRIHQLYMSNRTCYLLLLGMRWSSISTPIAAGSSSCLTYTVTVYAVLSSWSWTERRSETCREFCKNE